MTDPFAAPDPSAPRPPQQVAPTGTQQPGGWPPQARAWPQQPGGWPQQVGGWPEHYDAPAGPVGKERSTGLGLLLFVVTFGIYGLYWYFVVHDEMKRHTREGLGGPIALLIAVVVGPASPFFTSHEVGRLYERRGQEPPVDGLTGLWVVPGFLLLVLPIVWFVKTNGALNAYWRTSRSS